MKKIVGVFVCMLLITTIMPSLTAKQKIDPTLTETTKKIEYKNCYIKASGTITKADWPRIFGINFWKVYWFYYKPYSDNHAFVFFWLMIFEPDAEVTVYTEENGEVLWQNQGQGYPQLMIYRYDGIYIPSKPDGDTFQISIDGNAQSVNIKVRQ